MPAQRSLCRLDTDQPATPCAGRSATTTLNKACSHIVIDITQMRHCRQAFLQRPIVTCWRVGCKGGPPKRVLTGVVPLRYPQRDLFLGLGGRDHVHVFQNLIARVGDVVFQGWWNVNQTRGRKRPRGLALQACLPVPG